MTKLEDTLGDFRGVVYRDFRTIIRQCSGITRLVISPSVEPVFWGDGEHESCMFRCDAIEIDKYGDLAFYQGSFCLNACEIDTDTLVFIHDQLIDQYNLCSNG